MVFCCFFFFFFRLKTCYPRTEYKSPVCVWGQGVSEFFNSLIHGGAPSRCGIRIKSPGCWIPVLSSHDSNSHGFLKVLVESSMVKINKNKNIKLGLFGKFSWSFLLVIYWIYSLRKSEEVGLLPASFIFLRFCWEVWVQLGARTGIQEFSSGHCCTLLI